MDVAFVALEAMLAQRAHPGVFCWGNTVTMADICLIPQVYNAHRFHFDITPYPAIQRIYDACVGRPEFAAARPEVQPDASEYDVNAEY
jgi:glutathione S-transferase